MFSNTANIQKLTAEVLVNLTSFLEVTTLLQLSLTCKAFSHVIKDELVFRRLTERDYHVTEKPAEQTWVELYKELSIKNESAKDDVAVKQEETIAAADDNATAVKSEYNTDVETNQPKASTKEGECPHLTELPETINEVKRIIYNSGYSSVCDLCSTEKGTFLNMSIDNHNEGKMDHDIHVSMILIRNNKLVFLVYHNQLRMKIISLFS
jgi:hypothetical protein